MECKYLDMIASRKLKRCDAEDNCVKCFQTPRLRTRHQSIVRFERVEAL